MENIFNDLSCAVDNEDYTEIITNLNCLIKEAEKVKVQEISLFIALFNLGSQNVQIVAAEAIAEICKSSENRQVFTNAEIVNKLMQYAKSGKLNNNKHFGFNFNQANIFVAIFPHHQTVQSQSIGT